MALSLQTQIPNPKSNLNSQTKVVGGYDVHGTTTAVSIARALKIPLEDLLIKYPDTSPELLPKFLYSLNLYGSEVFIVDIAINVKNPSDFINTIKVVADNNALTFFDHHETNYKFLSMLPRNVRFLQFNNSGAMAKAISETFNIRDDWELMLVGVIGDRDDAIKELISTESLEFNKLYNIANILDVLVRQNLTGTIEGLYHDGIRYVEKLMGSVNYPPVQIADQLIANNKVTRYGNIIVADVVNLQSTMTQWLWKTYDELLRRFQADYLVGIAKVLDRQINTYVDTVFVVRYWLSESPPPKQLIADIISGRKVIGHDTAFSVSATSPQDAQKLAQDIVNKLQEGFSVTASYIPAKDVARSLQHDFRAILEKQTEILQTLTQILDEQRKNYEKYLDLKERQVTGMEKLLQSDSDKKRTVGVD